LYELPPDSRVQDALTLAGGLLPEADIRNLNLAASLKDGDQVSVPAYPTTRSNTIEPGSPAPQDGSSLVDLNIATLEQLDSLPGIGPTLAQRIIAYREQHGLFTSISAIQSVDGIGPSTFERIKDYITVAAPLR
jgi:competence protein ComEA